MKVVIVLPTFNERENITRLIAALQAVTSRMSHEVHILVVDDKSPDGTADAVRREQERAGNVHLIQGEKAGLGNAYIRGIRHALMTLHADAIFEMDSDFSHKPEDVPRLMEELDRGADFVIGSRYVSGGSIPENWGFMRRLNSAGGNFAARHIAGLRRIRDCTAGFRAIRTSLLKNIDLDNLRVQGYAFQVALLHAAMLRGAVIREVPVDFIDRTRGESKLGLSDIAEFIANVWWIRLQSSRTFIKFGIVGISGIAINLGCFTLLLVAGMNKFLASPVAIEASIVSNFFLNNYWTFRWRKTRSRTRIKGLKFNLVSLLALAISYGTFVAASFIFPDSPPQLQQFIGIIPATLVNYFMNSYWTFRERKRRT